MGTTLFAPLDFNCYGHLRIQFSVAFSARTTTKTQQTTQ